MVDRENLTREVGPIIRISPYELHINDAEFYNEFYSIQARADKYDWYFKPLETSLATLTTIKHDVHRKRRAALGNFFSPKSVMDRQDLFHFHLSKLCRRIENHTEAREDCDLSNAYRALSTDIIRDYCCNETSSLLDTPDYGNTFHTGLAGLLGTASFLRHFPFITSVLKLLPDRVVAFLKPEIERYWTFRNVRTL